MDFPRRIYTIEEFMKARECLKKGHKHRLKVVGSINFKNNVKKIQSLLRITNYYNFIRTYIRKIMEIEGISQLRETEATVWLNNYLIDNPVEGARFVVQKAQQMKDYLEGNQYYEKGEKTSIEKSIEFLRELERRRISDSLKEKCKELIIQWTEEKVL